MDNTAAGGGGGGGGGGAASGPGGAPSFEARRASMSRHGWPLAGPSTAREREQSFGAQSAASSAGTGSSMPSASVTRNASRRASGKAQTRSALGFGGVAASSGAKRRRDRHALALRSIREFLKGRSCYDCLPVSFRLVVLDTKLVVKPAIEVMWQAGVVSAPLWQSTSEPGPSDASDCASAPVTDDDRSASAFSSSQQTSNEQSDLGQRSFPATQAPLASSAATRVSGGDSTASGPRRESSPAPFSWRSDAPGRVASMRKASLNQPRSSAPPPGKAGFAGMLTVNDIIHLIQYYYQHSSYDNAAQDVERFRLERLRDIEHALNVPEPPLLSIEPLRPLFDACQLLMKTHARRLPLLDRDTQTGMDTVVSVLTQYRVLKFIAMNCRETAALNRSVRSLGIGTYVSSNRATSSSSDWARSVALSTALASTSRRSSNGAPVFSPGSALADSQSNDSAVVDGGSAQASSQVFSPDSPNPNASTNPFDGPASRRASEGYGSLATATLDTTVFDVVHIFSELGISAVPVLDEDGYVVDMYETVDVIDLVRSGAYQSLDLTIRQALSRRPKDFPGVMTCSPDDSLATIFSVLRTHRVHRLLILEPEPQLDAPIDPRDIDSQRAEQTEAKSKELLAGGNMSAAATAAAAAESIRQQQQQQQGERFGGDLPHRGRGRLAGILCLSDIMRYIIGATPEEAMSRGGANTSRRGSTPQGPGEAVASTVASTTGSMQEQAEMAAAATAAIGHRGSSSSSRAASVVGESHDASAPSGMSEGEESSGTGSGSSSTNNSGSASIPNAAARFDPSDVPPTIQEQPSFETTFSSGVLNPAQDHGNAATNEEVGHLHPEARSDAVPEGVATTALPLLEDADQTPKLEDAPKTQY